MHRSVDYTRSPKIWNEHVRNVAAEPDEKERMINVRGAEMHTFALLSPSHRPRAHLRPSLFVKFPRSIVPSQFSGRLSAMTVRETWRVHVTQVRAYSAFTACVCTWTCAYTCWRIAAGPNACVCVGHHVAAVCVLLLALTREKNVHAWPVRFTCAHTKLECKEAQSHRVPPSRSTRSSWLEITGPRGPQGGRERIARFNCGIEISRWTRFIYAASGSRAQFSYSQLASQKSKVVA